VKTAELFFTDNEGVGDAVVLAHAIGCDHRMWDGVAALLAPRFRVVRVDLRGHGRTPATRRPYSLEGLAEDVLAVADKLGIAKIHWVGLSMGAMIGMAFALEHPDRLARLVLANTTSSYGPEGRAMWEARARTVAEGGLEAIKEMVMGRYFSDEFREQHRDTVAKVARWFLATPVEGYLGCCDAIKELDYTADLPRIHARTLVIAGDKDAGTPVSMAEVIATRIAGAQLAVIPGAAHLSAVEKPTEFGAKVRDFLASP
jgi:3-oxoadipate enol-lactonase